MLSLYYVVYWLIDWLIPINQPINNLGIMSLTLYQQCVSQFTATTVCDFCHIVPREYMWCTFQIQGDIQNFTMRICKLLYVM